MQVLQNTTYEVDLDRILQSIHVYLQDLGMEEIRGGLYLLYLLCLNDMISQRKIVEPKNIKHTYFIPCTQ